MAASFLCSRVQSGLGVKEDNSEIKTLLLEDKMPLKLAKIALIKEKVTVCFVVDNALYLQYKIIK